MQGIKILRNIAETEQWKISASLKSIPQQTSKTKFERSQVAKRLRS